MQPDPISGLIPKQALKPGESLPEGAVLVYQWEDQDDYWTPTGERMFVKSFGEACKCGRENWKGLSHWNDVQRFGLPFTPDDLQPNEEFWTDDRLQQLFSMSSIGGWDKVAPDCVGAHDINLSNLRRWDNKNVHGWICKRIGAGPQSVTPQQQQPQPEPVENAKKGDVLVCISNEKAGELTVGKEYIAAGDAYKGNTGQLVKVTNDRGHFREYYTRRFRRPDVAPAEPAEPDEPPAPKEMKQHNCKSCKFASTIDAQEKEITRLNTRIVMLEKQKGVEHAA